MNRVMLIILLSFIVQLFPQVENALSFDGSNDYVNTSSSVTSVTTTQDITVEAWVYPLSNAKAYVIISKYYGGNGSQSNFMIARGTDQKLLVVGNGTNSFSSNSIVPLNTWTHIAVVFKSGTNNTNIYISGTLDKSGTLNYNTANSSTTMRIGEFFNIASYSAYARWSGIVDEIRLWNTVRTAEQINTNMNTQLIGSETGLVAYYGFNHGTANGNNAGITTLTDLTGHGYAGTLINFALTGTVSNWVEGVFDLEPPSSPTAVSATEVDYTKFTSNWNPATGASGYYLDVASDSLFSSYVTGYQDLNVMDVTSSIITGLNIDTEYYYRVRAFNGGGTSGNSNTISVRTLLPVIPDAPVAAPASNISYTEFKANWDPVSGIDGYYLDIAEDIDFTDFVTGYSGKDIGDVTNYTVTSLQSNTDYFYRIRAYNPAGTGSNSNIVRVRTLRIENALHLDGINDFISLNSSIPSVTTTQEITFEAWVYPKTNADTRVIASKFCGGNISESNFMIARNSEQKLLIGGNGTNAFTSNGIVPLNAWTHIAVVFKEGPDSTEIYISGVLDKKGTLNYNSCNSSTEMFIGEFYYIDSYPPYYRWLGIIDEVRLWDSAITEGQITDNINVFLSGEEEGLIAYYGFNHGTANSTNTGITYLNDLTGNGYDGTLYNFALAGTTSNWVDGVLISTVPPAPEILPATEIIYSKFVANWNSTTGTAGYFLDVSTDSGFSDFAAGFQNKNVGNVTSYTVSLLNPDTEYFYRVRAYSGGGSSGNSGTVSAYTLLPSLPDPPIAAAATGVSYLEFTANWSAVDGAETYYIDIATDAAFSGFVEGYNGKNVGAVTTANIFPLLMNTDYFYRVRAYNPAGMSVNSNAVSVKTLYTSDPVSAAPVSGDGAVANPYQIATLNNLYWIAENSSRWRYNYIQTSDIDAGATVNWFGGQGWSPIGNYSTKFRGKYDGGKHIINGLFINRPMSNYSGLFGYIYEAEISNLGITDCSFITADYAGCLSGYMNFSTVISGCFSTGTITGSDYIGGIVGTIYSTEVNISNCNSLCNVTGDTYAGGFSGSSCAISITDCYSTGSVNATGFYGGFIGYGVSGVSNCFWDIETSGQSTSAGGTGKTTAEMKTLNTFTSAGWDFTGESTNGSNDYWNINGTSNNGYPFLSWQTFGGIGIPQNLIISYSSFNVYLNWTSSEGASYYKVYKTDDPYAVFPTGWTLAANGIEATSWTDVNATAEKKFYAVIAVSSKDMHGVNHLKIKNDRKN